MVCSFADSRRDARRHGRLSRRGLFVAIAILDLALAFVAHSSHAADFYFSSLGSDAAGAGTLASPWQSIAKLNSLNLDPGDSAYFRAGDTFTGNITLDAADSANGPAGLFGGTPITLSAYGAGSRPVISSPIGYGLRATNAGGLEIRNLEFAGVTSTSAITSLANTTRGLAFENTGSTFQQQHVYIDNVVVHGFGQDGINFHARNPTISSGGFSDVQVTNSEIYSNGRSGVSSSASSENGLVAGGSAYDFQSRAHAEFRLAYNRVHTTTGKAEASGVSGNGIVLAQVDGAVIERNVAHHNGGVAGGGGVGIWAWEANAVDIRFNEAYQNDSFDGRDGGGFDLDGGVTNSVMQYNYSHGNHGAGLGLFEFGYASPMGGNAIRYNISVADGGGISVWGSGPRSGDVGVDVAEDSIFHNNTIIKPLGPAVHFFGSVDDVGVYNNLVVTSAGNLAVKLEDYDGAGSDFVLDVQLLRNAYWSGGDPLRFEWRGVTYNSLAAWANGTGQEKIAGSLVGLNVDPKLAGPFTGGVTLNDPDLLASLAAYRLLVTSALADAGANLSSLSLPTLLGLTNPGPHDFFGGLIPVGAALDIGAHELPISADFNADGVVDAADLAKWSAGFGATGNATHIDGDTDDADVDGADFLRWQRRLGAVAAHVTAARIPEPNTAAIAAAAAITALVFRPWNPAWRRPLV